MATLFGTGKDEAPTNGDLGSLAYMNATEVEIDNGRAALDEYQKAYTAPKIKPTLNLPFAKMQNFDPRVSFSRASDAYEYSGESQKAEENLVLFSEQFDNARWSKVRVTVLPNQTLAPNGTNTSDLLAETADTGQHYIENNPLVPTTAGLTYVNSWYVKKGIGATAPDIVQLIMATNGFGATVYANFNIANGTLGTVVGGTATITPAANGFYRISLSAVATATSNVGASAILVFTNNDDGLGRFPSYAGQTTSDVFVWGAQLEQRDTLTDYQRTTDRIIQKYIDTYSLVTSNKPRFKEIDPVTKERKGLLVEEARTNIYSNSNNFLAGIWVKDNVIIKEGVPSPLGAGYKLEELAENGGIKRIRHIASFVSGTTYTVSIYAKATDKTRFLQIAPNTNISTDFANFDLQTGQVTLLNGNGKALVEVVDGDWFRLSLTFTAINSVSNNIFFVLVNSPIANFTQGYTGDGYSGIYISQAQLEVGSFATSPILTVASAVTRALDLTQILEVEFNSIYNTASSTLYASGSNFATPTSNTAVLFATGSNSGTNDAITIARNQNTDNASLFVQDGSALVASFVFANQITNGNRFRGALSIDANQATAAVNNEAPQIDNNVTLPSPTRFFLGLLATNARYWNGHIDHVAYYPQALSADELAFLTRNTNE